MSVSQSQFVKITSGVGAAESAAERELIGRIFTDNVLLPPQSFKEFSSAEDVLNYFGPGPEYNRAVFYFSWVSKNITQPSKLSFGRWVDTAQAGVIFGAPGAYAVGSFTSVSTGALNLTIGATKFTLTGINLTGASNLAGVATIIQSAIQAHTAGGNDWTSATVTYNPTAAQGGAQFNLVGGVTGSEAIAIGTAASGTDLGPLLGWTEPTTVIGQGSAVETLTACLNTSQGLSDNFGSLAFIPTLDLAQDTEVGQWTDLQNVAYQFMVPVTAANAVATQGALANLGGCALTLSPLSNEFPELIPMTILAATNYDAINSVQNYEFQSGFLCTPSVTNDTDYETYTALGINFYLQTQSAGQPIVFYAQGVLTGTATDPVDQNTFANEQWLKSALAAQLMTLLLTVAAVSANLNGQAQITAVLQGIIQQALSNGTISVGKPLSTVEKLYITNATGDNQAWLQVQNLGYWLNVAIVSFTVGSITKFKAVYTLIYSKDDIIRLIEGTDILI